MAKFKKLFVVAIITLVVFSFGAIFVSADETEVASAKAETSFSVNIDDEETEYDLTDGESAHAYVDSYADNLTNDKGFESHIGTALSKVRESINNYATFWALVPPILAILLALITKEVYSSLFLGILSGGFIYSNFDLEGTMVHVFKDGFIDTVSDPDNIGIAIFLVLLGALVAMMNKTGASAAFGRWAATHIKSRVGAQLATIALGVLIFIDDYFNCLTVGSVMRPVTDKKKISRAKLSYLIDATAAPICIIAPISSWAAAVAGFAKGAGSESGMSLFIQAIPFNFYAILTIVMMIFIASAKFDYGPMKKHELNAEINGDLFTTKNISNQEAEEQANPKGKVCDLVVPVIVLIIACVFGMIYSGGFFEAGGDYQLDFIGAFSNSNASVGLVYGSFIAIIFAVIFFICRRVISFKDCMNAIPEGFKAMVPAIMILVCAWTLKTMTDSIGAKIFISQLIEGSASGFKNFLPAIIFLIAVGLSFATGTSWGTFGILIPIVLSVFSGTDGTITIISVSACMAGAVCGDHCSPISDTTIMASAGAQCDHISHVSTQLPYTLTVAGISFIGYIFAGFVQSALITLPVMILVTIGLLAIIKLATKKA